MKSQKPLGHRLIIIAFLLLCSVHSTDGAVALIDESFTGDAPTDWTSHQEGPGTGATFTGATGSGIDAPGDGWLRLTNSLNNEANALIHDEVFDSSNGFKVSFDFTIWGGAGGTYGADGLTFFLFDGSTPEADHSPGAFGGSLGYAQRTGVEGTKGGWLGIGIDEWGNFSNSTEGRQGGVGNYANGVGEGFRPNSVTVRGSGDGSSSSAGNYQFLGSTGTLSDPLAFRDDVVRPDQLGDKFRRIELEVTPFSNDNVNIVVSMQLGISGTMQEILNFTMDPSTTDASTLGFFQDPLPSTLGLGFSGSTGGARNYHEIRNLTVTTSPNIPEPRTFFLLSLVSLFFGRRHRDKHLHY